jgi:catechol 2,3-dioxygenase-like lactoylglutathione lyase family enzyme
MNKHRGVLHHMNINVSDIRRSSEFYGPFLSYLGYERTDHSHEGKWHFEDWKRWLEGTPHEITIIERKEKVDLAYQRRAVGHHNHIAFCAGDREDVDGLYEEVLEPLERRGFCSVEDPPCNCTEYGEGYYATFFFDPDGLKYEFVDTPHYEKLRMDRRASSKDETE